jgi:hypothetical protein
MPGVENRFPHALTKLEPRAQEECANERSLLFEDQLGEIAEGYSEDLLLAFRAMRTYADRRVREIEDRMADARLREAAERMRDVEAVRSPVPSIGRRDEFFRDERATYEAIRSTLGGHEGRYIVIKGAEVAGIWPSYEAALDGGHAHFGPVSFFVKLIA